MESNDPVRPKTTLSVSALIEIQFGFETNVVDFGRVRKGEASIKRTILILKDQSKRNLLVLNSKSPYIDITALESITGAADRIDVEVTVKPEASPGKLNDYVTAALSDNSHKISSLPIKGTIIGNVEATPDVIRLTVDTSLTPINQSPQEVRVAGTNNNVRFQLLSVTDSSDRLNIEVDTVTAGALYVINSRPNAKALAIGRNISGEVTVLTDDKEQQEITFHYNIIFPR